MIGENLLNFAQFEFLWVKRAAFLFSLVTWILGVVLKVHLLIFFQISQSKFQKFQEAKVAVQPFTLRLGFDIFNYEFEMFKEQPFTNKRTGEELSLSIIDGYDDEDAGTVNCVIEIKRKRIVSKTAKKTAK